jgi:Glyoxalase-like domain
MPEMGDPRRPASAGAGSYGRHVTTSENTRAAGIARFSVVALDCPDPVALARFYSALTGWPFDPLTGSDGWVQLDPPDGKGAALAFQKVSSGYRPPEWPGQDVPQQLHIDFDVPDLDPPPCVAATNNWGQCCARRRYAEADRAL